ncbi:S26 family signal peptidase [Paenibacillus harenae]|uniref:S26 family signal peptidase n=1 Tax=Paenibacillus harenae TaxID=306543 RepID=UPI002794287F|nr:S26 family signal peptidase [Paenibacillus harenae]MDQ0060504.1 signal peptidase I [Paenibacillus harenae]
MSRWNEALRDIAGLGMLAGLLTACTEERVEDRRTVKEPPVIEMKTGMWTIDYDLKGMDMAFMSEFSGKLVLNELEQPLQRGDVVYYKTPPLDVAKVFPGTNPGWQPPEYDIARVVALPGEAIEIRDGQIFNDNKKLDTFYGKALMWGEDEEAFFKNISRPGTGVCDEACQASMKDVEPFLKKGTKILAYRRL